MLIDPKTAGLMVIDVQARLVPAIPGAAPAIRRISALIQGARRLGLPVLASEHCPDKLGPTVAPIRALLPPDGVHPKTSFAFVREPVWRDLIRRSAKRHWVVAGFEAHVCVAQSVAALRALEYEVFVVADAVGSIGDEDKELALRRMEREGAFPLSAEMALFEWLETADNAGLRDVLALIKEMR